MKEMIKKVMRFYWHHSQAYSLASLPLNGLGAMSSFLVLFTIVSGVKFSGWVYAILFVVATIGLFSMGIIAKKLGLLAYWQSLNNSQNPELIEIQRAVSRSHSGFKGGIIYPKSDETIAMEDMFRRNDERGEDTEIGNIESDE